MRSAAGRVAHVSYNPSPVNLSLVISGKDRLCPPQMNLC